MSRCVSNVHLLLDFTLITLNNPNSAFPINASSNPTWCENSLFLIIFHKTSDPSHTNSAYCIVLRSRWVSNVCLLFGSFSIPLYKVISDFLISPSCNPMVWNNSHLLYQSSSMKKLIHSKTQVYMVLYWWVDVFPMFICCFVPPWSHWAIQCVHFQLMHTAIQPDAKILFI